ncbi:glycosyl transferase [Cellvibrio zantedeschiae]|uniref:Glycosyl transferase n=1 Tax=Cellvibrio zantedeschiae TaxID=1237077 RepID=A0ABQ3BBE8_9GAMM|nr:glycosyl transferase [Cellvibrio zantedeschiae]GGY82399.1 glycosyl transferase [Cellvibrio zantedeschiae]
MRLIYLAPLAWSSFAQRPHMFVRWFHEKYKCPVLWVNPYPTRFPSLGDFKRIAQSPDDCATEVPDWLEIILPKSLPIEPLAGSQLINALLWRPLLKRMQEFSAGEKTIIAIGKPSELALQSLLALPDCISFYDAMDDYPQFYQGLSRSAFIRREQQVVQKVSVMAVSSSGLKAKWKKTRADLQLIRNALMPDLFLPLSSRPQKNNPLVFGYLGTIAQWFDWDWIVCLAKLFPEVSVRLVGPCYISVPESLPSNIQILPACDHSLAIETMKQFDVGLIPFKKNQLTASVDPIKFYEYRALGIPVVATNFGEMLEHQAHAGTFLSESELDISKVVQAALAHVDSAEARENFISENTWAKRFNALSFE